MWGGHSLRQAQGRLCPPQLMLVLSFRENQDQKQKQCKVKGCGQECPHHIVKTNKKGAALGRALFLSIYLE
jgi:hypothetical protein